MTLPNRLIGNYSGRSIGDILVGSGRLRPDQAQMIVNLQQEKGLRFGDAAVELGLLTKQDVQEVLARQYDYAYLTQDDTAVSHEVVAAFSPFSPIAEQMRDLRSQLMLNWFTPASRRKGLTVVSADRAEGRSFIAANLAVAFSQLGERTLLIDADLRNPKQHQLFCLPNTHGLSSYLASRMELKEVVARIPGLMDLTILPAGPNPPNPQELLNRPLFSALINAMMDKFDVVIVDSSAGSESSDCKTIAARTQGALVVVRKDMTDAAHLQMLVSSLQHAGVALVGTVLNNG